MCDSFFISFNNDRKEVTGMSISLLRGITWYLVVAMFIIGITPKVEAGFSPSQVILDAQSDRNYDIAKIQTVIETKMIKERLEKLGFSADEVRSRLDRLSNQQVHQLALQLDDIKMGGDGLGVVIALLVIAILVVLLIQLTGHRVIIK
jgi:hypothetical protein